MMKKYIKTILKGITRKKWGARLYHLLTYRNINKMMQRSISKFCSDYTGARLMHLKFKIRKAYIVDGWMPIEYFMYKYDALSAVERRKYVCMFELGKWQKETSPEWTREIFKDKYDTYKRFVKYYKRRVFKYDEKTSQEDLKSFLESHYHLIVKPQKGYGGKKTIIIHSTPDNVIENINLLIAQYKKSGCVIEELIKQSDEMASFHPSSVNTVRITTVRFSDGSTYIAKLACARFGQGGAIVDNAGSGGILVSVDRETGRITGAKDEKGIVYIKHPNTQKQLIGAQIPRWEEAKKVALELATVVPERCCISWDLALTDAGWVMVEGNTNGAWLAQMTDNTGIREDFEYIKKMTNYN